MEKYKPATVRRKSGAKGWYASVTVPEGLRPIYNGKKQILRKIKGAVSKADAYDKRKSVEAEIYRDLDHASISNHPLCVAYDELKAALVDIRSNRFDYFIVPEGEEFEPPAEIEFQYEHLFDNDLRWHWYDLVRNKAGYVISRPSPQAEDIPLALEIEEATSEVRPLLETFDQEFRKVSQEKFAPIIRGKPFIEVAEEYHASKRFLRNRKTNTLKRQKSIDKEKRNVMKFIDWVGPALTVDEINMKLATDYAEALSDRNSGLVDFRGEAPSAETIEGYFSSLRNVLTWAIQNEYLTSNPWQHLDLGGYGEPPIKRRDWTAAEFQKVFALDMPQQDRLCLAILACTGARLDEIALLEWDQFNCEVLETGEIVHWFDLTSAIVKNEQSQRLIPILPRLAELIKQLPRGLNLEEPNRLFGYKRGTDNKAENKASRALMAHLRKVSADRNFTVHGLRHTFTTQCRNANIDWEMREFILGRSGHGEGAKYGRVADIKTLLDNMSRIDTSYLDLLG